MRPLFLIIVLGVAFTLASTVLAQEVLKSEPPSGAIKWGERVLVERSGSEQGKRICFPDQVVAVSLAREADPNAKDPQLRRESRRYTCACRPGEEDVTRTVIGKDGKKTIDQGCGPPLVATDKK